MARAGMESLPDVSPVRLLDSDFSGAYTHIHPILVLCAFYFQFSAFVVNPDSSLIALIGPLAIAQFFYCVICLPPVGTSTDGKAAKGAPFRKKAVGSSKSAHTNVGPSTRILTALLSLLLAFLAGTPLITGTLILFGAPITTHLPSTILSSAHLALLCATPLVYVHGVLGSTWKRIGALMLPIDEVFGAAIGTLLGAWLGAVPIPLDWDREWQKWPVTIVTGAYIGWTVGKFSGRYLFHGAKLGLAV